MSTQPSNGAVATPPPRVKPPFLRRVRIRNYKSIAFCDVTLEPLTILVGRNASGKSNFLDALGFLRDVLVSGVHHAVKAHGGREAVFYKGATGEPLEIEVEVENHSPDEEPLTFTIAVESGPKGAVNLALERYRVPNGTFALAHFYEVDHGEVLAANESPSPSNRGRIAGFSDRPFVRAYPDGNPFCEAIEWMRDYNFAPDAIRELATPSPGQLLERDGSNIASVIETTRENEEEVIDRISRYLAAITGTEFLGVVRYGPYETVRFRVPHGKTGPLEFDAPSMSDGTLRVFAALVAAYQIVLYWGTPSLVAIEEPETSLHPAAMRALVDALDEATGRTQILLTTHSAEMLDNPTIRPENVRVVEMVDGQTRIAPVDAGSVEIVRQQLDTLGGLERQNQLEPDAEDLARQDRLMRSEPGAT
jgi:predicted ATPase